MDNKQNSCPLCDAGIPTKELFIDENGVRTYKKPKSGYWYLTTHVVCPACGHCDTYKERMYGFKPKEKDKRIVFTEIWCGHCNCWY